MVWAAEHLATQSRRHVDGPLAPRQPSLANRRIGTDRAGLRRRHCHRSAAKALIVELAPYGLIMRRIAFEDGDFHTIEPRLLELCQDREVLRRDMSSPEQQIHAVTHSL